MCMYYDTDSVHTENLATIDEVSEEEWQLALELMVADCLATIAENALCVGECRGTVSLYCNCGDNSRVIVLIDWLDTHDELKEKFAKIRMAGWYVEDVSISGFVSMSHLIQLLRSLGDAGGELEVNEFGQIRYTPNIWRNALNTKQYK